MRVEKMFPSRWLSGLDLAGRDVTVVIEAIHAEVVGPPPKQEEKFVMSFKGAKKQLILNQTNCQSIAMQYGPETDNWIGQKITLYSARVDAFGKTHDAVRVREHVKTVSAAPDPITPAQPDDYTVQYEQQQAERLAVNPTPERATPTAQPIPGVIPDEDDDLWDLNIKEEDPNPPREKPLTKAQLDQRASRIVNQEKPNDLGLAPDEIALIESWGVSPPAAQAWAIDVGACQNNFEAQNSWKKIINRDFPNVKLTVKDIPSVMIPFYMRQREKLQEQAKAITGSELK
jgi:hypothetical protein